MPASDVHTRIFELRFKARVSRHQRHNPTPNRLLSKHRTVNSSVAPTRKSDIGTENIRNKKFFDTQSDRKRLDTVGTIARSKSNFH